MATLLTLKRRIRAAQNVSKTTRAMQMIAASKLKKAQDATFASRPYVEKLSIMTHRVAGKIDKGDIHPYMRVNEEISKTLVIALSPDKGLCGGLITNLLREFFMYQKTDADASYIVLGKKLEGQVAKLRNEVVASFNFGTTLPSFDMVYPLTKLIDDYYLSGKVGQVKVLYTDFTNFFSQTPKMQTLLPITIPENQPQDNETFELYEPELSVMLTTMLRHFIEMSLYQNMLESYLSEQAARMIAMQNATTNAKDIIEGLKLEYNKTRQAKITSELLDITGGRTQAHG